MPSLGVQETSRVAATAPRPATPTCTRRPPLSTPHARLSPRCTRVAHPPRTPPRAPASSCAARGAAVPSPRVQETGPRDSHCAPTRVARVTASPAIHAERPTHTPMLPRRPSLTQAVTRARQQLRCSTGRRAVPARPIDRPARHLPPPGSRSRFSRGGRSCGCGRDRLQLAHQTSHDVARRSGVPTSCPRHGPRDRPSGAGCGCSPSGVPSWGPGRGLRGSRRGEGVGRNGERRPRPGERLARSSERVARSDERVARSDERVARSAERPARFDLRPPRHGERGCRCDERGCRCDERGCRCDERGCRCDERGCRCDEGRSRCGEGRSRLGERLPRDVESGCRCDERGVLVQRERLSE